MSRLGGGVTGEGVAVCSSKGGGVCRLYIRGLKCSFRSAN